jgi:hypothetical protein
VGEVALGEVEVAHVAWVQRHGGMHQAQMDDITLAVIQRKANG